MRTLNQESQSKINPDLAIELLKQGNSRFVNNMKINRNLIQQVNETRDGQFPFAVIISCMDSRAPAETIFDQGLGDVFSIRVAGNIINDDILGSAEFGCKVVGAKAIVVLGHNRCGAIHGAIEGVKLGNLSSLLYKIQFSIPNNSYEFEKLSLHEKAIWLTKKNIEHSISEIRNRSAILRDLEASNEIKIVGGLYDVNTGEVDLDLGDETKLSNNRYLDSELVF